MSESNSSHSNTTPSSSSDDNKLSPFLNVEEIYNQKKLYKAAPLKQSLPIHNQPLGVQQSRLFDAFLKGDTSYIYAFDNETLRYRDRYLKGLTQQTLTIGLFSLAMNTFLYQQVIKSSGHSMMLKISTVSVFNAAPLAYYAYSVLSDKTKANEFLFKKYLQHHQES